MKAGTVNGARPPGMGCQGGYAPTTPEVNPPSGRSWPGRPGFATFPTMAVESAASTVHARSTANRVALAIGAGLATFVILLALDGFVAGRSLLSNLTIARSELGIGIEAIVTGDPRGAGPHFVAAAEAADRAVAAAGHPSMGIAGLLPVAGPNIDAAASVAAASRDTAAAGAAMVRVAETLEWTDIGLPAVAAAGSLDVEALRAATPQMDEVVARLDAAMTELEAIGADGLVGPVATGYRDALENLARRADLATRLRDAIRLSAAMFGGDRTQRYLLVVPSLGMPRAGGGAPSTVGMLVADQGSMRIESLTGGISGLAPAPPELASAPSSPDWPTAARELLDAARAAGAPRLDGAISLDAVALQDLVWVAGDVTVQHRKLPLTDATAAGALEIDSFQVPLELSAAQTHADLVSEIVRGFLSVRPSLETFAIASSSDAHARHLQIYARRRPTQALVASLGLAGETPEPEAGVLPVIAAFSSTDPSHVGALVDTRVRQDIQLRPDGSASILMEVSFENGAGTKPRSVLLGHGAGVPVGTFAADVTVYVPDGARKLSAETSSPSPITIEPELGYRAVRGSVSIPGGDSSTLTVSYVVRDAVALTGEERALVLRLAPQPTLAGIAYSLRVTVPEGGTIVSVSPDVELRSATASFTGRRGGPTDLELRYRQ